MDNETLINNPNMILTVDEPKKNSSKAKRSVIIFCVLALLTMVVLYYFYVQYAVVLNNNTIYYMYTNECPNCHIVKEYMNETNAEQRLIDLNIVFDKYNMDNPTSLPYLKRAAKECEIPITLVGVPFVYYNNECFVGRIEVIALLNKTISVIQ